MKRLLIALPLICLVVPAWAQSSAISAPGFAKQPRAAGPKQEKAPSALPGARAEPTEVAPVAKNSIDLPPNEAMFDAINRGDLPVVKDAVGRGADLNATNVLGLTPIELSVDLGRNQISFYLLSLRGGVSGTSVSGPPAPGTPAKPLSRAERLAAQRAERAEKAGRVADTRDDAVPAAPRTARLFAGGGGAPNPQAGFLGFDAIR